MLKVRILLAFSLVLTITVIALGAYTRLSNAGLGCPDWPGCYGHITVPTQSEQLSKAQALFPETPVEPYKAWLEMIHRYVAGILGLAVVAIAFTCARTGIASKAFCTGLVGLIVFQAALGMWTVTLKLMPTIVMLHLAGGFSLFCLLWVLYLRARPHPTVPFVSTSITRWARVGLIILIAQIFLGGWTSSNYAALMCTSLPICQGDWVSQLNFVAAFDLLQQGHDNYEFGVLGGDARTTIHVTHRIGAILTTLVLTTLSILMLRSEHPQAKRLSFGLLVLLTIQIGLGVTNVLYQLPLLVATAHNLGAALLLIWTVRINLSVQSENRTIRQMLDKPQFKEQDYG
ncbi:COX15/CtaA family protein [Vibrio sp. SCSIO 43136]|uniref:COX15/CtaA family protein n=1 Tax=Vibrio sp. SCSIO 43136 TaxID=2819101 RepID=UPI0020763152|nr:COX15/CtaA family protein [Vibrio sp. SCSIO 43136]USD65055.1 COX15/CtaA family protein [Vibrio sp. SCSIO 43136]